MRCQTRHQVSLSTACNGCMFSLGPSPAPGAPFQCLNVLMRLLPPNRARELVSAGFQAAGGGVSICPIHRGMPST